MTEKERNDIILFLWKNKEINSVLNKNIDKEFRDDFRAELFLTILEKKDLDRLWKEGKIVNYVKGIIWIQKNGKKSKYKFNPSFDVRNRLAPLPLNEEVLDFEYIDDKTLLNILDIIDNWLDDQHWFEAHLFRCSYMSSLDENNDLIKPMSLRAIEEYHENKISYGTILNKNKETMIRLLNYLIDTKVIEKKEISKKWLNYLI